MTSFTSFSQPLYKLNSNSQYYSAPYSKQILRLCFLAILAFSLNACSKKVDLFADTQGNSHPIKEIEKDWLIINYWASWCAPCREEVPELNELAKNNPQWTLLAISFDPLKPEAMRTEAQKLGFEFPVLLADPSALLEIPRPQALPTTVIFAPGLKHFKTLRGPQTKEKLSELIKSAQTSS